MRARAISKSAPTKSSSLLHFAEKYILIHNMVTTACQFQVLQFPLRQSGGILASIRLNFSIRFLHPLNPRRLLENY